MAALRADSFKNAIKHWKYIANDIHEPLNNDDYERLSKLLNYLLDIVGDDEDHELIGLIDVVSHVVDSMCQRRRLLTKF